MFTWAVSYMENIRQHYVKSGWPHVSEVTEMSEKVCATYTYICNSYLFMYDTRNVHTIYIFNIFYMYHIHEGYM